MSNEISLKLKSYNNVLSKKIMKDVCNIFAGGTPSTENKSYWNGHINWIPSGLVQDCVIDEKNVKTKITNKGLLNSSAKMIKPDSALLAITGATCGKSGYLPFSACANQSVMAFEPYTYSAKYIYYLFQKNKNKILKFQAGGAQAGLNKESCENLTFLFHEETEQKQIAEFLSNVDSLLEEKKKELEKTKQFKQTMLSKMFPLGNSKVPEIRFNGFNDNWNEEIYGNIFEKINNNSYSRDLLNYKSGTSKSIHYGDILIKFGFTVDVNHKQVPFINQEVKISTSDKVNILKSGDVVFADTAEDTTAGKAIEIINNNNTPTFAGLHTFASRPLKYFEIGFLGICFNTSQFHDQLIPFMQGTKVTGFNYDSLCKTLVRYPNNKEQKKIVEFFETLNKNINNLENEIVNLEHLKSTLLNKMFA